MSNKKSDGKSDNRYASVKSKAKEFVGNDGSLDKNLVKFSQEKIQKIYQFPAKLEAAEIHNIATSFGFNSLRKDDGSSVAICPCCEMPINTIPLPLSYPTTPERDSETFKIEQYELTSGISMFFTFIKMIIMYMILRFLISDAFNLITSLVYGGFCNQHADKCEVLYITKLSSYNKIDQESLIYMLDILNLVTVIISIIFFNLYRKLQYRISSDIDQSQHTQDDYTLFCTNIPIMLFGKDSNPDDLTVDYESVLHHYFQEKINTWIQSFINSQNDNYLKHIQISLKNDFKKQNLLKTHKVSSISLCFDLSQFEVLKQMRKKLMKIHIDQKQHEQNFIDAGRNQDQKLPENSLQKTQNQIKVVNKQQINLSQKFSLDNSMAFNLTHFVGKAFISFECQHYRDYIFRQFQSNKKFLKSSNDTFMQVHLASSPSDINWYNMKIQQNFRLKLIATSYFILFTMLIIAFAAVLFISSIKIQMKTYKDQQTKNLLLTVLTTVLTLIINNGLGSIIKQLTDYQKHQTRSKHLLSLIWKTVITQFINTAIIYYASDLTHPMPYLSDEGLVVQVSSLFLTSAVIQIALNIVNPSALIQKLTKFFISFNEDKRVNLFQIDLNQKFELPEFDLADRYSYYILQIFTAAFYSYIAPVSGLCLIFTLMIQYWVDKFNLFKRSSYKYQMNFVLSRQILKLFQLSLLIFTVGNLIFSIVLHNQYLNKVNVVSVGLAFIYTCFSVLAPRHIQQRMFGLYEEIQTMTYSQCLKQSKFRQCYWTRNPGTMLAKQLDLNTNKAVNYGGEAVIAGVEELKQIKENIQMEKKKWQNQEVKDIKVGQLNQEK